VVFAGTQSNPEVAVNGAGQVYVIQPWDRDNSPTLSEYSAFTAGNTPIGGLGGDVGGEFQASSGLAVAPRSGDVYAIDDDFGPNDFIIVFNPQFTKVIGQIALSQFLTGIAVDGSGQVYIGLSGANSVEVFSAVASGTNPAPSRIISGPNTGLSHPFAIALIECLPHRGRP
jgi:hypothetical protein